MPIYMDVHIVPGVKVRDVATAHREDLLHQHEYGCTCMTYWIDESRESIFCLIEAPDKDAVKRMHHSAHGLVPNKIIEVSSSLVQSFLGRIYDPEDAEATADGLKLFHDASFRIIMLINVTDSVLLRHRLGEEKASTLLTEYTRIIRNNLAQCEGREVEHEGTAFIISFSSAVKAMSCAVAIQKDMPAAVADVTGLRICLHGGEPVETSNRLFGDTLGLAQFLCSMNRDFQIAVTSSVKDMVAKHPVHSAAAVLTVSPQDEQLLRQLYLQLDRNWQDAEFDLDNYCHGMNMSKSQLYRKSLSLTGLSPNQLLKDFRLERAKELLKKKQYTVAQVTFEAGFTSPSYFTKCFKEKYGLLPMAYMDLL